MWLLTLLYVMFASILPGIDATVLQIVVGVTTIVLGYGLGFAFMIATIIWLYDAFRPVYDRRSRTRLDAPAGPRARFARAERPRYAAAAASVRDVDVR